MIEQVWVVIAGNFRQSEDARRAKSVDPRNWLYMGIRGCLRGRVIAQEQIIMVGDWWNRPDLGPIMDEVGTALYRPVPKGQ